MQLLFLFLKVFHRAKAQLNLMSVKFLPVGLEATTTLKRSFALRIVLLSRIFSNLSLNLAFARPKTNNYSNSRFVPATRSDFEPSYYTQESHRTHSQPKSNRKRTVRKGQNQSPTSVSSFTFLTLGCSGSPTPSLETLTRLRFLSFSCTNGFSSRTLSGSRLLGRLSESLDIPLVAFFIMSKSFSISVRGFISLWRERCVVRALMTLTLLMDGDASWGLRFL